MFDFDYPKVRRSLGWAALHDPYPALILNPQGVIHVANLMAFWLWDAIRPGEPFRSDALLNISMFNILAANFERIPVEQNIEFYAKNATLVKRMDASIGGSYYTPFITAMKAAPALADIYQRALPSVEREWEYPLYIAAPGQEGSLLKFQVSHFRLEGDSGLLVTYSPKRTSLPVVEEQYSRLSSMQETYVHELPDPSEQNASANNSLSSHLMGISRNYYPTIIQDPLWYIIGENKAHQLLTGASVMGIHFFELFFAPPLREWLGPLQETSAPRAVRYFDVFTTKFLRENHELHAAYLQLMQRLLHLSDFTDLLDIARKLPIRLNIPEDFGIPFYTCRVILPWPLSPTITLQFRSMVRTLPPSVFVSSDRQHYEVMLVPENYETEAGLILLHLLPPGSSLQDSDEPVLPQSLRVLAALKTVMEGLTRKGDEYMQWEPESVFARIHKELGERFSSQTTGIEDEVLVELLTMIEVVNREGMVEKELLLAMLKSLGCYEKMLEAHG